MAWFLQSEQQQQQQQHYHQQHSESEKQHQQHSEQLSSANESGICFSSPDEVLGAMPFPASPSPYYFAAHHFSSYLDQELVDQELEHNQAQEQDYASSSQDYLQRWKSWQMQEQPVFCTPEPQSDAAAHFTSGYHFSTPGSTAHCEMQVPFPGYLDQFSPHSSTDFTSTIVHTTSTAEQGAFLQHFSMDMTTTAAAAAADESMDLPRKKQKLVSCSECNSSEKKKSMSNTSSSTISTESSIVDSPYPSSPAAQKLKSDEALSTDRFQVSEFTGFASSGSQHNFDNWMPPVVLSPSYPYQVHTEKKVARVIALNTNLKPRARQGSANDPQSIAARHRRERISDRLKILQELVPNSTKVDLVTMLEKAINYVKFLQLQLKVLTTDEYWPHQAVKKGTVPEELASRFMVPVNWLYGSCGMNCVPEELASRLLVPTVPEELASRLRRINPD